MDLNRREQAFERQFRKKLAMWDQASHWPGIIVCAALTWIAFYLHNAPFPPFTLSNNQHPVSAVLLALLLGLILRNLVPSSAQLKPGVDIVIKRILPLGIILLGAGLDFYNLLEVGLRVLLGAAFIIAFIILTTRYLSRFVKVKNQLSLLIGIGTAICGSSAIVAAAPVIQSEEEDIAIAIATINLLGVLAMLLFPILGAFLLLSPEIYGEWCGLAIHATPQVIAAGFAHSTNGQTAGEIATVVKLTRISLLGPTIFIFSAVYAHQRRKQEAFVGQTVNYAKLIPTFVIFFLGLAFLRTTGFLPEITLHMTDRFIFGGGDRTLNLAVLLGTAGKWLITCAMAGVGLITEFRALKTGGIQPFTLGLISTGIIAVLGLLYASL